MKFFFLQFSIHTEILVCTDKADGKSYMKQPVCFFQWVNGLQIQIQITEFVNKIIVRGICGAEWILCT
jgi:hypothetical protein